ncbi:DUF4116 domain-containing protein [Natroniella sulfidigena]|uniref:DUF4116 domain-containing protein n=1 Tax=Natroniella sulfidigena TaxID=723921 RepID=UPI00200A74F9|nr:DUF4116 domain-containing protein [Natroniella sulfidigena]MCK8817623.1 DUF4116 domain-containing protein [Natroniella sulfidigena]
MIELVDLYFFNNATIVIPIENLEVIESFFSEVLFSTADIDEHLKLKRKIILAKKVLDQDLTFLKEDSLNSNSKLKESLKFLMQISNSASSINYIQLRNKKIRKYLIDKAKECLDNKILIADSLEILKFVRSEETKEYLKKKLTEWIDDNDVDYGIFNDIFVILRNIGMRKKEDIKFLIDNAIYVRPYWLMYEFFDKCIYNYDKEIKEYCIDKLIESSDYYDLDFYFENLEDEYLTDRMKEILEDGSDDDLMNIAIDYFKNITNDEAQRYFIDKFINQICTREEPVYYLGLDIWEVLGRYLEDKDYYNRLRKYIIETIKETLLQNYKYSQRLVTHIVIPYREELEEVDYQELLEIVGISEKEAVLEAVKQNGDALRYVSKELRGDKEVVLEAVKQDSDVLRYASEELQNDEQILEIANKY